MDKPIGWKGKVRRNGIQKPEADPDTPCTWQMALRLDAGRDESRRASKQKWAGVLSSCQSPIPRWLKREANGAQVTGSRDSGKGASQVEIERICM